MKILISIFAGLALLMPSAVLAHDSFAQVQSQETSVAAQIKANIIGMWDAVEAEDLDAYIAYFHPDYTLFGEGDIYLQSGRDLERASYEDYLKRVKNVRTFMHQPEVKTNGNTAWITYYWTDSGFDNDDNRFTSKGKSTRIFVKENGKWLCIHSHFTAVE